MPIIAPADGYIIEKNVTPGKTVELSAVTFVIGDLSRVWMLASVRQEDLGKLRLGQPAFVMLPGQDDAPLAGKITNLGQEFDPETRVMQVRIELANPNGPSASGDAGRCGDSRGRRASPRCCCPPMRCSRSTVRTWSSCEPRADRFGVRPVRVGETADGNTPILEGIKPGDQVVVRGSFILKSQLLKSTLESE